MFNNKKLKMKWKALNLANKKKAQTPKKKQK